MSEELAIEIPHTQADSAWKDVLTVWFPEFMMFFYPELAAEIDWLAGYESLDKELQTITTQAMLGNRFVDKLMKVKSREGKELWVLLHIEIQGEKERDFEKRLFEYYYRLYDRYGIPIMTLAILADGNRAWRPSVYQAKVWGTEVLSFRFFAIKLLDYADKIEFLEQTANPFGVIVLAQLAALKTRKNPDARFTVKSSLTRKLYEQGLNRDTILNLYKFLDWVLTLPEALEIRYNDCIHQIEEERTVAYITTAERIGMKKGYEQGIQQGIQQGMQQGMQQGALEGEKVLLTKLLNRRFAHLSSAYVAKIKKADAETLLMWGEKILDAKSIEDVFGE